MNDAAEQPIWTRVSAVIDRHSRGDLEYASEALSSLWGTLNQGGDATAAAEEAPPPVRPFTIHPIRDQP